MALQPYWKILSASQKAIWDKLAGAKWLSPFYLAGGTALALQLGHRESIDFDFFSESSFSNQVILSALKKWGGLTVQQESTDTLNVILDWVKLSFFKYPYPLLVAPLILKNVRVADATDIAAMKIIAIAQRGTKKDFVDLYFLLKQGWNLESIFEAVAKKFQGVAYNKMHLLKSLTYFVDADSDEDPKMFKPFTWETAKKKLTVQAHRFVGD